MKRRCNICLRNVDHLRTDRFNDHLTICYDCQKVLTKIVRSRTEY